MKYEFDFPYEIKTCQTCPFMRLYKGSTHCAFASYGEQRSIRYGTCPLRVAGWHTGTPTEEGWYLVKYICICEGRYKGKLSFRAVHRYKDEMDGFIYEDGGINADDIWKPIEWQKIEEN